MALAQAKRYLDQAAEIPSMKLVSLTGGEPFLSFDSLVHLVSYASKLGFSVECITNCLWAKDHEVAEQKLRALTNAGLSIINISADDFHQEYIPFERVKNCYEVAKRLELRIVILCVTYRKSKFRLRNVINMLGNDGIFILEKGVDPRLLANHNIIAIESGFIPAGRGAKIAKEDIITTEDPPFGPCEHIVRDTAIDPTGKLFPCCSGAGSTQPLLIEDANKKPLFEAIEQANGNKLVKLLATEGPHKLFEKLSEQGLIKQLDRHVDKCHLCYDMLSNPVVQRTVFQVLSI